MSEEKATKRSKHHRPRDAQRLWRRLQVRMAFSYIAVSILTVLLFELIIATIFFVFISNSPLIDSASLNTVRHKAQIYAMVAALQGSDVTLDPHATFQANQPSSIVLPGADSSEMVSYVNASSTSMQAVEFALLITPNEQILASSDPSRYPASASLAHTLPRQITFIHNALAGQASSGILTTTQGRVTFAVQPIIDKAKKPIGAIYVQSAPLGVISSIPGFALGGFFTALLLSILLAPTGTLFGILTTRNLLRRIHRLVSVTSTFAEGDYSQRVPAIGKDEIGQLEQQFNHMADQLVESIAQQHQLTEQQVRMEERARNEQELRTARYIQRALLPKEIPQIPNWHLSPFYQPAREVGGDFYDFLPFEDGRLGIIIGDATDKGVSAALLMATTCTMLRTASQEIVSPGAVLTRVNDLLANSIPSGTFATCFYALLDPLTGKLLYANAGHDIPYSYCDGKIRELYATGMPLGMMPGMHYNEQEIVLEPGETILFYSDGLVEAHNTKRDMFGFPRLKALLQAHHKQNEAPSLIDFLLTQLKEFTGTELEQEDDVTLLTIQRTKE